MRFVCDSCRAQYMISDEKVGPKGVKVRCKKCSYVILVKKSDGGAKSPVSSVGADADDALATQVMQNPLTGPGETALDSTNPGEEKTQAASGGGGFFSGVDEDEIGAVFDQVLSSGPHALPKEKKEAAPAASASSALGEDAEDRLSTRVMDAAVVTKLTTESGDGDAPISGESADSPGPNGEAAAEWFAAIDDKQTGPLSVDKLKEHWGKGEIGPDSLAWKAGMPDWIPISEIAELAAQLSPRSSKPVLVAPTPAVSAPGAVVSMPVESAFSAGAGLQMSGRGEMQVPLGTGEDVASWRPSAASALASLVKEEMDALARPQPASVMSDSALASPGGGLLDLPTDDDRPPPGARTNGHSEPAAGATARAPANPYLAQPAATYSSPAIAQYRPPPEKQNSLVYVIGGVGAVIVLMLGVLIFRPSAPAPAQVVIAQPPPAPAPVAPAPAPVAVSPTPAQPTPVPAPAGTVVAPPTAPAVAPTPVAPTPVAPQPKAGSMGKLSGGGGERKAPKPDGEKAEPVAAKKGGKEAEVDDFDAAFGGETKTKKTEKVPERETQTDPKRSAGYIPPAPGGANIPETLGKSDVYTVVSENKAALASCNAEQKKKDPSVSGTINIKWTIQTSGKTSNVTVVTEEFKSAPIASCLGGVIKGMTFPKHKKQGDPITFPFKF